MPIAIWLKLFSATRFQPSSPALLVRAVVVSAMVGSSGHPHLVSNCVVALEAEDRPLPRSRSPVWMVDNDDVVAGGGGPLMPSSWSQDPVSSNRVVSLEQGVRIHNARGGRAAGSSRDDDMDSRGGQGLGYVWGATGSVSSQPQGPGQRG